MSKKILLGLICTLVSNGDCANILFYFIVTGYTHISSLWPLMVTMGERGHNVTLLSSYDFKQTNPRVKLIYASKVNAMINTNWDKESDLLNARMQGTDGNVWEHVHDLAVNGCEILLEDASAHDTVYNSQFDLVISDGLLNECGLALGYYQYKCPYISYYPISIFPNLFDNYGIPVESSTVPDLEFRLSTPPMSFYNKLISTVQPIRWWYKETYQYYPRLSAVFKDKLKLQEMPNMGHVKQNTKLILTNTHYSKDFAHSRPPLFVDIAGLHISEDRDQLEDVLEEFVTKPGSEGFIHVSFGTIVRISMSHSELKQKLFAAMGNFSNFQFVWKWEGEPPPNGSYPSNIHFAKWLPQQDLYAHKNIRGTISHGGSNSINEAIHFGVPMLILPIFGDQDYNAYSLVTKGLAIVMEISEFSQEEMAGNLKKLVSDKAFHERIKKASSLFRDRPMKPLDTALWWVEYTLRHKESNDLMPTAVSQTWYDRRLLHVWYFLFFLLTLTFAISIYTMYTLFSIIYSFFHGTNDELDCDNKSKIKYN